MASSSPKSESPANHAVRLRLMRETDSRRPGNQSHHILYRSRCMHELILKTKALAKSSATVLITGESGTGKELFARLIHEHSSRSQARFVRVNCAALSENLMESELFGHERGAFTGALQNRQGRFEWADDGSLLLDEISEISPGIQAKLLRVLEENEFQRVGSNESVVCNVRVIATSNRDLFDYVRQGGLRPDLYYRLNVLRIHLPPLRQRREDIPILANRFVNDFRHESPTHVQGLSKSAFALIKEYDWPGNVRQLRNCIHSACILTRHAEIQPADLSLCETPAASCDVPQWMLDLRLDEIEQHVILGNLNRFSYNKTKVASVLGVTTRTLANKIKQYQQMGLMKGGAPEGAPSFPS